MEQPCVFHEEIKEALGQLTGLVSKLYEWKAGEAVNSQHMFEAQRNIKLNLEDLQRCVASLKQSAIMKTECSAHILKMESQINQAIEYFNKLRDHSDNTDTTLRLYVDGKLDSMQKDADNRLRTIMTVVGITLTAIIGAISVLLTYSQIFTGLF